MRRITKIGSIVITLLVTVPALSYLDFFDGAEAADAAPLVYSVQTGSAVRHVAYANGPVDTRLPPEQQIFIYAYIEGTPQGDRLVVRERQDGGAILVASGTNDIPYYDNVTALAISHDGRSIVFGNYEGWVHYFTAGSRPFERKVSFDTRSHVTDVAIDLSGRFSTAVTYHGDVYLFEREQFVGTRTPYLHHNPLTAFRMVNPDRLPQGVLDPIPERLTVDDNLSAPLTLRIYSHVAMIGTTLSANGDGLGIVAATTDGQLFSFNIASFRPIVIPGVGTVPNLAAEPAAYRLTDSGCDVRDVEGIPVTMPCDAAALAALVEQVDGLTSRMATNILSAVSKTLRDTVVLDPVLGLLGKSGSNNPIIRLDATQGRSGAGSSHIFVAALGDGTVHAFRGVFVEGSGELIRKMWTSAKIPGITDLDISGLFLSQNGRMVARMAVGSTNGRVYIYDAEIVNTGLGSSLEPHAFFDTGNSDAIRAVAVSEGDANGRGGAGDHVAFVTDSGRIGMVHGLKRNTDGTPRHIYDGVLPIGGRPTDLDISDGGSVLAATDAAGIALYGFLLSVDINAPALVDKLVPWTATALPTARDSTVIRYDWTITPIKTLTTTLPVALSGATITHAFEVKGQYLVLLEVEDDRGFLANDTMTVSVGSVPPIIKMSAPSGVVKDATFTIDFNGTRDPDMSPGAANDGIASITFNAGDGRDPIAVDVATKTLQISYATAGTYTLRATATDYDLLSASTSVSIAVSDDGGIVIPDPDPPANPVPLTGITMARTGGQSMSYGGNSADTVGRYVLRDPQGQVLYDSQKGGSQLPKTPRTGVLLADGSAGILGLSDGSAVHVPLADAGNPFRTTLMDAPIVFSAATLDGSRVLLADRQGDIVIMSSDLRDELARFDMQRTLKYLVTDDTFHRVMVVDTSNIVYLFTGQDLTFGPEHQLTSSMNVRSAAMPPNLAANGRSNLFLGRDDGRVQIMALVGDRMQPMTPVDMDLRLPITRLVATPFDSTGGWKLLATSESDSDTCGSGPTSRPCGSLMLIDSRGPLLDGVPQRARATELQGRAVFLEATPTARHAFVGMAGATPRIHRYDTLWHAGPVLRMGPGLPSSPIIAMDMAASGTSHTLFGNGQLYWLFGPPTAAFRAGSHDHDGTPLWGERVTSRTNTTFDSGASLGGDGTITKWAWDFNGDGVVDSTESDPVFVFNKRGIFVVRLTVWSTLMTSANTTSSLVDRWEQKIEVWNPPPVAVFKAKGPGATTFTTDPITMDSGQRVSFDASGSYDPDGSVYQYRFVFGNGIEKTTQNPAFSHDYRYPGVYHARVVVSDLEGFVDESEHIRIEVLNQLPVARLFGKQDGRNETEWTYTQNVPVRFYGRSSSDADGTIQAYQWELEANDGTTITTLTGAGETFDHSFASLTSDYTIRLRVQDNSGGWSPWTSKQVFVDDGIRLRQSYNRADRHYINPTEDVIVTGFVHDFGAYPTDGAPVALADVMIRVWYDGPLGSTFTPVVVEELTLRTGADGKVVHTVKKNDASVSYRPGQWRVEMTGALDPSWDPTTRSMTGGIEWSAKTLTVFIVEPPN